MIVNGDMNQTEGVFHRNGLPTLQEAIEVKEGTAIVVFSEIVSDDIGAAVIAKMLGQDKRKRYVVLREGRETYFPKLSLAAGYAEKQEEEVRFGFEGSI